MISFVYFDLGGVLVFDLMDLGRWDKFKRHLGVTEAQDIAYDELYDLYEPDMHKGKRDTDTLIPLITERFGIKFPKGYSLLDDIVSNFEKNDAIWPIVKKAQRSCRIGMLTNMYPHMLEKIKSRGLLQDVEWDVIIDSSVVGVQKPETEMFELAEKKTGVDGGEILFVDNSPRNIDKAKKFGWQTFLYSRAKLKESNAALSALFQ